MVRKKFMGLCMVAMVVGLASAAWAGIPDPDESYATTVAADTVSVLVVPGGSGSALNSSYGFGTGPIINATIEVWLRDATGTPIYLYPFADIWLETEAKAMVLCPGGSTADQSTDIAGYTTFSGQLFAGCCGSGMIVVVNGTALAQPAFNMLVNSPDMNCDLVVNLTDVVLFSQIYYGTYDYCADYYWDGLLNLSDIVLLAQGNGSSCP
jgi:hypothetical protein